jgi:hypothetical protein
MNHEKSFFRLRNRACIAFTRNNYLIVGINKYSVHTHIYVYCYISSPPLRQFPNNLPESPSPLIMIQAEHRTRLSAAPQCPSHQRDCPEISRSDRHTAIDPTLTMVTPDQPQLQFDLTAACLAHKSLLGPVHLVVSDCLDRS